MNDNFWKISRLLLNAIHKRVFPLDFTLAIDFQVQGLDPGFLLSWSPKLCVSRHW